MWVKLCCLLLYFLALFVLARVFEAVAWYESGFLATQLVDPVALSFRKLRTILECRGLGYSGLPEKKDVRELVEKSGTRSFSPPPPTRGEGGREGGRSPATPAVPGESRRPWAGEPGAAAHACGPAQGERGEETGSPPPRSSMEPLRPLGPWAGGKLGDGDVKNPFESPNGPRGGKKASVGRGTERGFLPGCSAGWLPGAVGVRTGEVVVAQKGNVVCCEKRGGEKKKPKYTQGVTVYSWGRISPCIPAPLLMLLL